MTEPYFEDNSCLFVGFSASLVRIGFQKKCLILIAVESSWLTSQVIEI